MEIEDHEKPELNDAFQRIGTILNVLTFVTTCNFYKVISSEENVIFQ